MNGAMEEMLQLPLENKRRNVSEKPYHGYLGPTSASKTVHLFSEPVLELGQILRRIIVESLGVEKYLDEHINSTYNLLRVNKYEAPQTTEKKTWLMAHTDKNITSILYQNEVDGLEIQTKDGEWIPVKFSPDSFLIILGESFNVSTFSFSRIYAS
ncbi:hypothetical protein GH714_020205 [Hevea brasiliensis]|uniref:Isopenicillin N synthase-like Fe(2+) 2OG dioxygenase domain-containing protein n=1 Tax=Hevea brasiliensis TaxID=3981 RepID=A0A6A6LM07_HEVBR|nr:hypothetical protein GH714_020043 [Hevea brasiliensis]KAF2301119.1 hypothetical protein GH714_020205 [Hevea brasiliensis]